MNLSDFDEAMQLVNALREAKRLRSLTNDSALAAKLVSVSLHLRDPVEQVIYAVVFDNPEIPENNEVPLVRKLYASAAAQIMDAIGDNSMEMAEEARIRLLALSVNVDG